MLILNLVLGKSTVHVVFVFLDSDLPNGIKVLLLALTVLLHTLTVATHT